MSIFPPGKGWLRIRRATGAAGRLMLLWLLLVASNACEDPNATTVESAARPLDSSSQRIVSLSALATRFVLELGAGEQLVGIDAASASLPGLGGLEVVDLATARMLEPDLVLLPDLDAVDARAVFELESEGARLVEFAPHDLEDAGALSRGLGAQLVGTASAAQFERRFSRPLALISGSAPQLNRIRVVAVVDLDPVTLAGGHSFETDLIEIGGGNSVTHGGEESRIVMTPGRWDELAPDLVILTTRDPAGPVEKQAARERIPDRFPLAFFDYDRETFWLGSPEVEAERMRALIAGAGPNRAAQGRAAALLE